MQPTATLIIPSPVYAAICFGMLLALRASSILQYIWCSHFHLAGSKLYTPRENTWRWTASTLSIQ